MFDGDDLSSGIKYILQYIFFGFVNHEWKRDFISELAKTSLNLFFWAFTTAEGDLHWWQYPDSLYIFGGTKQFMKH